MASLSNKLQRRQGGPRNQNFPGTLCLSDDTRHTNKDWCMLQISLYNVLYREKVYSC